MRPRVVVVMGVSGSGKSSVGQELADRFGWSFVEGDAFHPRTNIDKMARGEALTDEDRLPWLRALRDEIVRLRGSGERCVVACSALKQGYREVLRRPGEGDIVFVHLAGPASLIRLRMDARDHFMRPGMLEGQFAALEEPGPEEAVRVSIDRPVDQVVDEIVERLGL